MKIFLQTIQDLLHESGFVQLLSLDGLKTLVMFAIAGTLIYLAIARKF